MNVDEYIAAALDVIEVGKLTKLSVNGFRSVYDLAIRYKNLDLKNTLARELAEIIRMHMHEKVLRVSKITLVPRPNHRDVGTFAPTSFDDAIYEARRRQNK